MNNVFVEIALNHNMNMFNYNKMFMMGMAKAKQLKESESEIKENDYIPYARFTVHPKGNTDWLATNSRQVMNVINNLNKNTLAKSSTSLNKPPVGMEVPTTDVKSDDEIKSYYKDLRTVLHDRFEEMTKLSEGGEGWVRFIDTLATPEERASNYAVPESFDSVYSSYLKDKKITKVTRSDVTKAIKTICDYDTKMMCAVKEAEEYAEEYAKEAWKLSNSKEDLKSFNEFVMYVAKCMYLMEEDYINTMCLEARKNALLEDVKNASKILYTLCTHNPRNLNETRFINATKMDEVESLINSINENVGYYIQDEDKFIGTMNETSNRIAAMKESWNNHTKNFLDSISKYESYLDNHNGIGMSSITLYEAKDIISYYNECVNSINSKLDRNEMSKLDIEELAKIKEDSDNFIKCLSGNSVTESLEIHSPIFSTILRNIAEGVLFDKDNGHIITKYDLNNALRLVKESKDDIDVIEEQYNIVKKQITYESDNDSHKVSPKTKLLNDIESARRTLVKEMSLAKVHGLCEQFGVIQAQSEMIIAKATRGLLNIDESSLKDIDNFVKNLKSILE